MVKVPSNEHQGWKLCEFHKIKQQIDRNIGLLDHERLNSRLGSSGIVKVRMSVYGDLSYGSVHSLRDSHAETKRDKHKEAECSINRREILLQTRGAARYPPLPPITLRGI